jgi:hypothetical protein
VESPNVHIPLNRLSFDELFSGLTECGRSNHLPLILSKNENRMLGQSYLMVSRTSYGLVRLDDVDLDENNVYFDLQDTCTEKVKRVPLDIKNPAFCFLLISWQDVRMMMLAEAETKPTLDDLLEFDFYLRPISITYCTHNQSLI